MKKFYIFTLLFIFFNGVKAFAAPYYEAGYIKGLDKELVIKVDNRKPLFNRNSDMVMCELSAGSKVKIMDFSLNTLKPVSEPVVMYAAVLSYEIDGEEVGRSIQFAENPVKQTLNIPEKEGYTSKWSEIDMENFKVYAIYTPKEYEAVFKADGNIVESVLYTVETAKIKEPEVPEKAGYTGKWETYELKIGGVEINAVYTMSDEEKQRIKENNRECVCHFKNVVHDLPQMKDLSGYQRIVRDNIVAVGEGLIADDENYIEITKAYILERYDDNIQAAKNAYSKLSENEQSRFKADMARAIKDDETYAYFEKFYNEYFS